MEKVIKFLVNNQADAYSVIDKLKSLDKTDEISLAESYVLEKSNEGKVSLKDERGMTFEYTAIGALSGGLLGLLAGPAGFVLGTAYGALLGTTGDLINQGTQEDLLDEFGRQMPNGKSMVISHIYEDWETPIDTSIGGIAEIERINVDDEIDNEIQADIDEMNKDIEDANEEMKNAVAEDKEKIQAKIDRLKAKQEVKKAQHHSNVMAKKKAYKKWFKKTKKKSNR